MTDHPRCLKSRKACYDDRPSADADRDAMYDAVTLADWVRLRSYLCCYCRRWHIGKARHPWSKSFHSQPARKFDQRARS